MALCGLQVGLMSDSVGLVVDDEAGMIVLLAVDLGVELLYRPLSGQHLSLLRHCAVLSIG